MQTELISKITNEKKDSALQGVMLRPFFPCSKNIVLKSIPFFNKIVMRKKMR